MLLEKFWVNRKDKEHNFIVFNENIIYRLKASKVNFSNIERELNQGIINDKFIGLPKSYLRSVQFRDDDNGLRFYYGEDSEDEIIVSKSALRKEIFDFLDTATNPHDSVVRKPSLLGRIKKPLIAIIVLSAIFIYVYSIIQGINQGYEYEIVGGGANPGIAGIVLMLAGLGLTKNIMIFLPLYALAGYSIFKKYKDNSEIYELIY